MCAAPVGAHTSGMSTHVTPRPSTGAATPRQLDWLRGELAAWTREGLLDPDQAEAVLGRYHARRRLSVGRLLLLLGVAFVGVGLIWLVAANLDQLSPLGRFLLLSAIWLGLLVGGEVLGTRIARGAGGSPVLVLAVRTLAALAYGSVVFQAAQSLQVPAWEPSLVGWWAAGALVHAYAVRSLGPLTVGLVTGLVWFLWAVLEAEPSGMAVVLALLAAAALATGVAALHTRWLTGFSAPWREAGALLALAGLFAAALPFVTPGDLVWNRWLAGGVAAAGVVVAAGAVLSRGRERLEPLGVVGVAGLALLLVAWDTGSGPGPDTGGALTTADWLHAVVSVGVYVLVAIGVAVLGTLRDSWRLTALATGAIVVFTTFQSFAVFARIIEGAWLFLALGLVLLGTGVLFDRVRRGVAAALENAEDPS